MGRRALRRAFDITVQLTALDASTAAGTLWYFSRIRGSTTVICFDQGKDTSIYV
jgi:hypothetical protein